MKVRLYDDVEAFRARVQPWLLQREAEHNLLLGLIATIIGTPERYGSRTMVSVEEGEGIRAVALMTPPHQIVISMAEPAVARLLADELHARDVEVPAANGPVEAVRAFAERWGQLRDVRPVIGMRQRIYRLEEVRPHEAPGTMREATERDLDLLAGWFAAFTGEVHEDPIDEASAQRRARWFLEASEAGLVLWEDEGQVVSMAGHSGRTPNGTRVNAVYTPHALRRRGYASALVAALSQRLLDSGLRFCFLYTDLSNPTSNAIYQRIGYEPVLDVDRWLLEGPRP